jgi:hypothetical protein
VDRVVVGRSCETVNTRAGHENKETPRTLDELVTWGSLTAEKVFKGKGELAPVYFIWSPEWPDGKGFVPAPVPVMKALFEHHGVDRYVFIGEAWTGPSGSRPSEHPDRREVVMIVAEDGTGMKAASRAILRPASRKPKLAPIEMYDEGMGGGGMANLLQAKMARH